MGIMKEHRIFPDPFLNELGDEDLKFLYSLFRKSDMEVYKLWRKCPLSDLSQETILRWEAKRRTERHHINNVIHAIEHQQRKGLNR